MLADDQIRVIVKHMYSEVRHTVLLTRVPCVDERIMLPNGGGAEVMAVTHFANAHPEAPQAIVLVEWRVL